MLRPLHARCYDAYAASQPWFRKPGWPVNRWRSLLWLNALLIGMALALHLTIAPLPPERRGGLAILWLVINAWLLVARLISYRTMERHLPARDEIAGGPR